MRNLSSYFLLVQKSYYCSRSGAAFLHSSILFGFLFAAAALAQEGSSKKVSKPSVPLYPRLGRHIQPGTPREELLPFPLRAPLVDSITDPAALPLVRMTPTRSSFLASWNPVVGAAGYRIDVSTDPAFASCAGDYTDFDVGNVLNRIICRLQSGTRYFYRVRAFDSGKREIHSEVLMATTAASSSGLVINPTFDSSITNNPNAAAIQAMINRAIALYQPLFADPVTAEIRFRYATTQPDGSPLPEGIIAGSYYVVYYSLGVTFIESLEADAKTTNDAMANANFSGMPLTTYLVPSSAGGRALGLDTPPVMFADGSVGPGGPYDGIVTLNSSEPLQFTRPTSSTNYDAQRSTEHEIDEVLGLGSYLGGSPEDTDFRPMDLFSWSAPGTRTHAAVGARYFSINNGITNIVDFNQNLGGDLGDWESDPCPQANPYVQNAFSCQGQSSDVTATSPEAIGLDVVGYDLVAAIPPAAANGLANISTRAFVGTGDHVLIGGFIITGTQLKKIALRGMGPSLRLDGTLADPYLEVHNSAGAIVASNDNWRDAQAAEILAAGFAPGNETESVIITTLNPGSYTFVVGGVAGGAGIGLGEVYDLDQTVDSKLANISTRTLVQTGDNVMIGGFIVIGDKPGSAIVRAIGPSLSDFGVDGVLGNPTLELYNGNGDLLAMNDDWMDGPDQEEISDQGLAPTKDKEAALLSTLAAGAYTAIVRGVNNTTGVALVEVYAVP